jgi:hypothetical protein
MKETKAEVRIIGIVLLVLGALVFIRFTNDHMECDTIITEVISVHGEKISTEKHICKEKFNL